ncbi:diaminopimelate decarboxylase [Streptomyces sp. XM4193]|uniref:diaminopimelate decarboxylase n=1 Tax=Streptomyces sp. XM4193 TaxID=2929782 RepID=UPI001FF88D5C|nr:diaminopimelate decarboxylase [Streptomyces sp. XM4193]MCK1796933.1 diaminopimelate decarboxylase [Streptomyces sp. XM4193]
MNDTPHLDDDSPADRARAARRDAAVAAAVRQGLVTAEQPVAGLLDTAALRESAGALHAAFEEVTAPGQQVLHAFAVKAAPLVPVLRLLDELGLGCEVASPGESALARAAGVAPRRTVLDSPAKTAEELREALRLGVAINVDNPQELDRLDSLRGELPSGHPLPPVGLRINPQLGAGSIDAMSTATATSKFGVALADEGARDWVLDACRQRPWLNRLHVHTGSQGIPLPLMAEGVAAVYALAEEVNAAAGHQQITGIDIGGGLPVNFASDRTDPTFAQYARLLRERTPGLFDGRYALVTEFGRSLAAKAGTTLARVEYVKSAGGRAIAVTHAGAQTAVRTVFAPESWPLRIDAYDSAGLRKHEPDLAQDVAGPCCFAGDLVARDRSMPALAADDLVALLDTGAYYFSNPFSYNSLPRPAVYGYTADEAGTVRFATVRPAQSTAELVAESGGSCTNALTAL